MKEKLQLEKFFEKDSERFINREISWLEFNIRVLKEAMNSDHPLLERLKFLSISSSNLDEFYMVRVAGLKDQIRNNINNLSNDGLTPKEQLVIIEQKAKKLIGYQYDCWKKLQAELKENDIAILSIEDLDEGDKLWMEENFINNIYPALSPIAVDSAHPFPFLPNLSMAIVFNLKGKKSFQAVVPLPSKIDRFVKLPGEGDRFVLIEDVIKFCQNRLFPGITVTGFGIIRITRDSDLEIEEDAEDLVSNFESAVKRRRRGIVIRLKISSYMPKILKEFVKEELCKDPDSVVEYKEMIGLSNIIELYNCNRNDLKFSPYAERFPERINDFNGNCFEAIKAKDIVIHHPYESFDVVVRFLSQAASDPDVVAIKQTLYRTSNDSEIVKALIAAAEAGKSVTAVVELKARFDEEKNIKWAKDLERAGAQVIFGFFDMKTHAKISLAVRRESNNLKSYVHFGTGNYHPVTAKIYSDLSFFTCDPDLCSDANIVFNYLTGYATPKGLKKIAISPINLRSSLEELIYKEIEFAKESKPANIWAKMNSLVDSNMIDLLYYASSCGVKIDLVVRGICSLRPGIKGLSDNITVKSIIGRFLEHARIYCFGNGKKLPSSNAKIFISSADLMYRNLNRRVEVLVPIHNDTVHDQILQQIMVANMMDNAQSWYLSPKGEYKKFSNLGEKFSAHKFFMKNPSLSGRGTALYKERKSNIYDLLPKINN